MDALVDDIFGVVLQELEDVLHLGLVGQPPQPDAVPPGARGDQLLGYHSHGLAPRRSRVLTTRMVGHGEAGEQGTRARGHGVHQPGAGARLAGVLRGPVEDLLHLGRGGSAVKLGVIWSIFYITIQPEELDVSRADDLLVLEQGLVALGLLLEQHESVPSGAAVRLLDKQDPSLLVQDVTSLLAVVKELNL